MENQPRNTHPMIIIAATSVTFASLVAMAWFAGWIPGTQTSVTPPPVQVDANPTAPAIAPAPAAPVVTAPALPEAKSVTTTKTAQASKTSVRKASKQPDYSYESTPGSNQRGATPVSTYPMNDSGVYVENSRQQPPLCKDCATVESVREVKQDGEGSGLGAISGGVVGGLLGNQIGGGRGKTVGAIVGAVGGAYAGHEVEKNVRSTKHFEVTVRLDDGNTRVFTESQPPSLQQGDRVRISNDRLVRM